MKIATVALVIRYLGRSQGEGPELLEVLSDDREIHLLQSAVGAGEPDPLRIVHEHRDQQAREEDEFGDYVEELLCQPFIRPEIQEHGIQWLKSKIRIEQYQKTETQAAEVIAGYAYRVYQQDRSQTDFFLAGPVSKVRIRVFIVGEVPQERSNAA